MKTLYTNAHLYLDGNRAYEKGALLVEDGRIVQTYYQVPKSIDNDISVIDVEGDNILPSIFTYVDIDEYDVNEDFSKSLALEGIAYFVASLTVDDGKAVDKLINFDPDRYRYSKCFGLHIIFKRSDIPDEVCAWITTSPNILSFSFEADIDQKVIDIFKAANRRVLITNSDKGRFSLNFDGCWGIYDKPFTLNPYKPNVYTTCLLKDNKYISFDDSAYPDSLKLLFKIHDMRYLLAKGKLKNYIDLGLDLIDISNIMAMNYYRFYGIGKRFGGLLPGKEASFIVVNKENEIIASFIKGDLVR